MARSHALGEEVVGWGADYSWVAGFLSALLAYYLLSSALLAYYLLSSALLAYYLLSVVFPVRGTERPQPAVGAAGPTG